MKNITIIDVWMVALGYILMTVFSKFIGRYDTNEALSIVGTTIVFSTILSIYPYIKKYFP